VQPSGILLPLRQ